MIALTAWSQTANQFELRKYNSGGGMTSFWVTPENSKAFGLNGSGVPAMLAVGGSSTLAGLSDVAMSGLSDLDLLKYNFATGEWVNFPTTAAGLALLDDASASAQRTTLGLGTAATATLATAVTNNAVPTIHNAAGSPDRAITGISSTGKIVFSTPTGTGSPVWAVSPSLQGSPTIGAGSGSFSSLKFYDSNGGTGDNYIGLRAPNDVTSDMTFILPATDGTSGQALTTNGSGTLSFATVGVSDGDYGSVTVGGSGTTITIDSGAVTDSMLAGSISPSKVTGTAVVGAVGSTDNAIIRADGTGGGTTQGSPATMTDTGAPTFYDKITFRKSATSTTGGFEVDTDPLNPGMESIYILPPANGSRLYFGKSGLSHGAINYMGANNENFGNIISVSGHYQIIEYGGTGISLLPFNGPVNLSPAVASGVKVVASYVELDEMTAPSAPGANKARLYLEDNGSGKSRLMVLFPTGAAQQAAIEP